MTSNVNSLTFAGVTVVDVNVQAHIATGLPAFTIVGLPDKTIAESKERVRAALSSIGLQLPAKRITVNLAPADLLKEGSHFDLAIACCLLSVINILPEEELDNYFILGELSLDGSISKVVGVLPAAVGANARGKGIICPMANGQEAAWSGNENILAPDSILSLINHFKGVQLLSYPKTTPYEDAEEHQDLYDIKGQEIAKRALEIAASGGHNMLMSGPPGVGKSMLARRLQGILPPMDAKEILECSMVASIAGILSDGKLQRIRPFRNPHHSCSIAAMVGGGMGRKLVPGEISLAHNGVLFLDELPEFPAQVLEALRQPIETREISIARVNAHITYPAKFQLIAAMNPCRCGYLDDIERNCNKAPRCAVDYQSRISGPLLDRIDLNVELSNINIGNFNNVSNEDTKTIANRVLQARIIQQKRYDGFGIRINSDLDGKLLLEFATPNTEGLALLNKAAEQLKLSMRGYNRILRVARTIADMENVYHINKIHIAEALHYRQLPIRKSSN
ncbi:Competence protein ComM [Rickettsiales bacterium Ac37b]|nr:Competence protein ComM [Rickettsiales bacterium Ac37b]